jgi:alkanesulfonate monooxygenase SsuD/methylene tetrahydromethanopterin reductase-like flavin-dependent oxidoreductase (luciferase family)
MVGSPQEIAEKILRRHEQFDLDRFMGQVDIGGLATETVLASIERFASDVAPSLRRPSSKHHHLPHS